MIYGLEMRYELKAISYYISRIGGAVHPFTVPQGHLLFEVITDGSVYPPDGGEAVGPGWIFAHAVGQQTVWRSPAHGHYACMTAAFMLDGADAPVWPRRFCWPDAAAARDFAREMLQAFHRTRMERAVVGDLLWSQLRFRAERARHADEVQTLPAALQRVVAHMDRHYAKPLDVPALARLADLSPSHLHARFREALGESPHHYLVHQRMRAACHLLATTALPVKAVAPAVGYPSVEHFCRSFKRHTGESAAAYRRRHRLIP
jgi:transcriptional regulator GlxA family with amidase domain